MFLKTVTLIGLLLLPFAKRASSFSLQDFFFPFMIQKKAIKKEDRPPKSPFPPLLAEKEKKAFCGLVEWKFKTYGWPSPHCSKLPLRYYGKTAKGNPLVVLNFGQEAAIPDGRNTTLIMCGVHGDEITPPKFCFDVIDYLSKTSSKLGKTKRSALDLSKKLVLVAPIASPDSFLKKWPTRTNANGVDINRNLPTKDWNRDALRLWRNRYRKDPRRYPGKSASSEAETVFQVYLIEKYKPKKIISVHSPLTMLDYDGPGNYHLGGQVGRKANQLLIQMSKEAKRYRIKNYPFFPGSLGNWAGNERNIPTYTLELPSSDNRKHKTYWRMFKGAIDLAIMHDIPSEIDVAKVKRKIKREGNPSGN